ncbi:MULTISPECIES: SurA N-terminal domain-containing protein [Idiomarina]|jgi:peptidyl-prolyl cis-trans isomerase D|uniref:Periplasmic chaperone PpiD n=4 Tax=Idiomarina TaxID=135575 RepID=A0A8I1G6I9_9GAMM|nr:SurA N-terminal domain-containing protein [Idiomarina abyssalis]MAL83170.1 peptidylprolyl isomerase [Idiomarina sp.]MBJ7266865.1 SurA N-terminal domain-containing protein [Idiomarina abyssalis]MBJ7273267.1 SurA N-terminal domain-containing protein [Idiomarina abyssalis]MBJ7315021.1 SurA N-terminal domain-containing protein [Idiomarina abyssalis]MDA6066430.1 SurA N-terminal domain-containing protein [Idiomarina abyssalis]|tara:strand:- start:439 stop:2310 length:1872 start_codon:yes stop_codon:yes gene_type:complete
MLERIREGSQSFTAKAILVLIILTFALAGVGGYITGDTEDAVAKVNGEEIPRSDYDRAYENERSRLQEQFGDMFSAITSDPEYMRSLRSRVLEQLIEQELLVQYAEDSGMRVGSEQVKAAIRDIPQFRTAGQFDNDVYLMALRNAGYSPEAFAKVMQQDMTRNQLLRGLSQSEFVLEPEALAFLRLQNQTRSGGFLVANNESFEGQVEVAESDIETFYQQNQDMFRTEEKLSVAYVELSLAAIESDIEIADEEVREYYEQRQQQYATEEERRVSHILIEFDTENAKEKAEEALAELEQGADFAEVAQTYSDDTFSAEQGGDLDWVEAGMMDEDFDAAVFELENIGDLSEIVETSFGYHIIKLTDLREGTVTPFSEVEDEVRQQLLAEKAEDRYFEKQQKLAEISFEQPDTLEPAADEIGATVRRTDLFTRERAPTPLSDDVILNNLFSEQLIEEKLNSDVIETSDDRSLVVRVTEHQPVRVKDLDEVREQIVAELRVEKAQELALQQAEEWMQAWQSGEETSGEIVWVDSITRNNNEHPRAIVQELFSMSPSATADENTFTTVALPNGDAAVVALTELNPGNANEEQLDELQSQLQNRQAQVMLQAFINNLKSDADIQRLSTR